MVSSGRRCFQSYCDLCNRIILCVGSNAGGGDPWGGITTSTIPDPWGGIGAVGVPPSRASPLNFNSSPPKQTSDPWGSTSGNVDLVNPSNISNDPWAAPADMPSSVSPAPIKSMLLTEASETDSAATACKSSFGTLPFFPYELANNNSNFKMSVNAAVDPFSPGESNDVMSAFGNSQNGGGASFGGSPLHGTVSPSLGAQQPQTQSPNPWDLSGLDPMSGQTDLLGNSVGIVSENMV